MVAFRVGSAVVVASLVVFSGCRGGDPPATPTKGAAILSALRGRPGSPFAARGKATFDTSGGVLRARFVEKDAEPTRARVTLPMLASAAVRVEDAGSGAGVDVSLRGASSSSAQTVDGHVVYPEALAGGATLIQRPLASGVEDFVNFETRPAKPELTYDISPSKGVSGLRLVDNTLELLDAGGAPRLRVAPPYVVGADGVETGAILAVEGCAVDSNPSAPWGRAVTAPGATHCTLRVRWPESVAYPAVVDPRWTTTGAMITARQEHTATLLSTGKVLVVGGRTTTGTAALSSAELYDRATGLWAATGSISGARRLHSATQLNTSSNATTSGKVLVAGGIDGTSTLTTAQLYSPTEGTWIAAGNLNTGRYAHTATLLAGSADGKVLLAGGVSGSTTLATAAIYNPASGAGAFAATTGPLPQGVKAHTATRLATGNAQLNNKVLLVGGNNGSLSLSAVYLFDPTSSAFSTLASLSTPREGHTATLLADGKLLVTGGKNGSTTLATTLQFDPGTGPGSWSTKGNLTIARWGHTATLLPATVLGNGQLLVAGGNSGSATLSSSELYSVAPGTWAPTAAMAGAVQGHTATLLPSNMVLLAGGLSGTTVQGAAQLYDTSSGLGCSTNSQCASGFCVSGVCCDTACNGGCGSCNLAGFPGTCKPLSNTTACRASAGACDVAETCNGTSVACPADAFAAATATCRGANGVCDAAETCTGTSAACPADALKPANTACTDDGNLCTQDKCNGTSVACQHPAGNAGTVCRVSVGLCDVAESCNGTSTACPTDGFAPATTTCRGAAGECDVAEICTGTSAACPANALKPANTPCTDDGFVCTQDKCDGTMTACQHPAGNPGTVCRAADGLCDVAETCTGSATACPADGFLPPTTTCRPVARECDVAETCTGTQPVCPPDVSAPNGAQCSDGNGCTLADTCQSGNCTAGTPVTCTAQDQCHVAGVCQGSGTCTNPVVADGTPCTGGQCAAGSCQSGTPTGNPPTPIDPTVPLDFRQANAFLYEGPNAQQVGVVPGTIKRARIGVLRGRVTDGQGQPLSQVTVRVASRPEYGATQTADDGVFSLAVNGGEQIRLAYDREGFLPVQRTEFVTPLDYGWFPDVTMTALDSARTIVDLGGGSGPQVATATPTSDASGPRQSIVIFPSGTQATITENGGAPQPATTLALRSTEYTVGPGGPQAMPGPLPPSSGYTYAVELSVDEALGPGTRVDFNRPVINYVDNFLHFPVGSPVPVGYYDRVAGMWVPAPNGRVIRVIESFGGFAELDTDGDSAPDDASTLAALGIDDEERATLATLYLPGQDVWRVPVTHLTPWDYNWPLAPPEDFVYPDDPDPRPRNKPTESSDGRKPPCDEIQVGSSVACSSQTLSEAVPITGTPFSLVYTTSRSPAYGAGAATTDVKVSGPTIPASVKRIEVSTTIAGRLIKQTFAPAPNITTSVPWDGRDAYGRAVTGRQPATVSVTYVYGGVYNRPLEDVISSFGRFSEFPEIPIDGDLGRGELFAPHVGKTMIEHPNASLEEGLGGWTLDVHHTYDPRTLTLTRGDNKRLSADALGGRAAANTAKLLTEDGSIGITDFRVTSDGKIYTAGYGRILRIGDDGAIEVVATDVEPTSLVIAGTRVFFSNQHEYHGGEAQLVYWPGQIKELKGDGSVVTLAGSTREDCTPPDYYSNHAAPLFFGNEGPATDACLENIRSVGVAPDGTIYVLGYVSFHWQIRRITSDGIIHAFLSGGFPQDGSTVDKPGFFAGDLAISGDYSMYLNGTYATEIDFGRYRPYRGVFQRLLTNGAVQPVLTIDYPNGSASLCTIDELTNGTSVPRCQPSAVTVGPDGLLYAQTNVSFNDPRFPDWPQHMARVVRIRPDGVLAEAFAGFSDMNVSKYTMSSDGTILMMARPFAGLGRDDNQYWGALSLYRLYPNLPSVSDQGYLLPASDGSEIYSFDNRGRHLRTYDRTGAVTKLEFQYNTTNGLLTGIADRNGLTTTIERDGSGKPTAIVAPNGQRTTLAVDPNGYLSSITSPTNAIVQFTYVNGAMTQEIDARNGVHRFTYDPDGRLIVDRTPTTGEWTFSRSPDGSVVSSASAEGVNHSYAVSEPVGASQQTIVDGAGLTSTVRTDAAGMSHATMSNGVETFTKTTPDPRFGAAAPYVSQESTRTPSGLTSITNIKRQTTVSPGNPLVMTAQTQTITVNGKTTTVAYDGTALETLVTSPAGRQTVYRTDDHGRLVYLRRGTLAPVSLAYDGQGRRVGSQIGTGSDIRTTTVTYDPQSRPDSVTDASSRISHLTYDAGNRLTSIARGGGLPLSFSYNGADDLVSLTPPGGSAFTFGFTAAGDTASYSVPGVGGENPTTGFEFDLDRRLTRIINPAGTQAVFGYEPVTGRIASITYARDAGVAAAGNVTASIVYAPTTGNVQTIAVTDGPQLTFQYDGPLLLSTTWSGSIAGSISHSYDSDFRVISQSVNGGNTVSFSYDADGLPTALGDLTLTRDIPNGFVTDSTLGGVTDHTAYTMFGEVRDYEVRHAGQPLYHADYQARDALGRIETKVETIQGVTTTWSYGYDDAGRLSQVMKDGTVTASYGYDAKGNRTSGPALPTAPVYDVQDRLLSYGHWAFTYTAGGDLSTKTDTNSGAVTRYHYDSAGALREVRLPDGRLIEYVIDAAGRRAGKKVDGVLVKGWLYGEDDLTVVAELDGSGGVVSRFVDNRYFVRGGATYRVVTDEIGTVRLVVDVATGAVAQRLDYDEFGNVLQDTSPGFQPLGFGGGHYDPDTGLVRFRARDYDPTVGRWTARDPIMFESGEALLYAYVGNDPVNHVDPTGLVKLELNRATGELLVDPERPGADPYVLGADSGKEKCRNNPLCERKKDQGPTPRGDYHFKPSGIKPSPSDGRDWGPWRVRLTPDSGTNTFGRDRFYLHGGKTPGTSGCIQINREMDLERLRFELESDPDDYVPLLVR